MQKAALEDEQMQLEKTQSNYQEMLKMMSKANQRAGDDTELSLTEVIGLGETFYDLYSK